MSLALFLRANKFQLELAKVHLQDYSLVQMDPGTTMILLFHYDSCSHHFKKAHTEYSLEERSVCPLPLHTSWAGDIPKAADPWGASSVMLLITNANRGHVGIRGQKHVHAAPILGWNPIASSFHCKTVQVTHHQHLPIISH